MHIRTRRRRIPVIPIIPLLDILVILLIFFMLTTTFPEKRESLSIDLPMTNLPSSSQVDRRVSLEIAHTGEMRLADAPVDIRGLEGALKQMKKALPDAKLELKADEEVSLQLLLEVWEILTATGFPIKEVPVRVQVH